MNVLMVSPFFPGHWSGACTRSYHLLKALGRQHTVSLLVLTDNSREADGALREKLKLRRLVQVTRPLRHKRMHQLRCLLRRNSAILDSYKSTTVQQALDALFDQQKYEIVLFESALMAADYELPSCTKVIVDEHDIEYELLHRTYLREHGLLRKWYNWWESRQVKPVELKRCADAQGVFVTSEREASLLRSLIPNSAIWVVPNGVDVEFFQQTDPSHEIQGRIIFTGAMDHYPNIEATLSFAKECWPLVRSRIPSATWEIVGRNPPRCVLELAALPGVFVTGGVPDVRPHLANAMLAIAPLSIGSGTRLKILEAFASGKAVVATSLGCEGLKVSPGEQLLVADQPETFANCVVELLQSAKRRTALRQAGRTLAETYSWEQCGNVVNNAVEEIANSPQPRPYTSSRRMISSSPR
jgi:sugar transferase (PEP-CTERM/EpsH1 system associated)